MPPAPYLALVLGVAIVCQLTAYRLRVPSILLLLVVGFGLGQFVSPETVLGRDLLFAGVNLAVGVILFELLTGQLPFSGRSTMDVLLAHATEEPPSFARLGVSGLVPPAIERVVQWCLAKEPSQRPRHARELAETYTEALATHQVQATPAPPKGSKPVKLRAMPPAQQAVAPIPPSHHGAPPPPPEPVVVKSPATPITSWCA